MAEPSTTRATRRKAWRGIRLRLVAVLMIPTLAALGLAGLRLSDAIQESLDANRAASIANALPDSFRLALQLQVERDTGSSDKVPAMTLRQVQANTDAAVRMWQARRAKIDASQDPRLQSDLNTISGSLASIGQLRQELAKPATRIVGQTEYTNTLNLLLGLAKRLPDLGSAHELYREATGLGQVRTAAEALAKQRTIVTKALSDGEISQFDLTALAAATESYQSSSGFFYDNASPKAQAMFTRINGGAGDLLGSHAPMQAAVESLLSTGDPDTLRMTPVAWGVASGDFLAQMAGVISTAASDLAKAVDQRRTDSERDALVTAATTLAVLLLALLATVVLARSILRPLNRLRDAALDIARHGLPERVRTLEESDEVGDLSVSPIYVGSKDEIAEVGTAFDAVHAEAIRLAGEQAQMRANVSRMFVNLSRRSQSLVERQLRLIDELEAGEQDPEHLANLFRLDHLATRMRRNDESLMVLAGGDTGQGARGPVPVLDVLRAASSEVEQFARVEIESGEAAKFRGSVAGDLVHLLAELIENATNFSPPDSTVVVRSTRTSPAAPLVIEVRDLGIGMTPLELEAANEKLHSPRGLDADVARMMGLVVASRLADRHGLSVELRANSPRGVVARVEVPVSVLVQPETAVPTAADAVDPLPAPPANLPTAPAPEPLRLPERQAEPEPLAPYTPAASEPSVPSVPAAPAAWAPPAPAEPAQAPAIESTPTAPSAPAAASGGTPTLPKRQPAPVAGSFESPAPPAVRPPEGYTPPAQPIASEPPVKSWFTTTVPLRDPEELLNTYLTGRAEGVDGAIRNPLGAIAKRGPVAAQPPAAAEPPIARAAEPPRPAEEPPAGPLTSSGLPTRVPRANLPQHTEFDPFGPGTPPAPAPVPDAEVAPPAGPVLDPLIAELAADVLSAPTAAEALSDVDDGEEDSSSIFATLQSEWFTRRTPLEARRSQPDAPEEPAPEAAADGTGWVSPGDEGWRRAAELAEPAAAAAEAPVTADGLPMRIPGRNLVPGSAAPVAAAPAPTTPENVVALPRLERRRTRGLSSFQQGVSRARTTDGPTDGRESAERGDVSTEEITVPGAYGAPENRAHEEHQ